MFLLMMSAGQIAAQTRSFDMEAGNARTTLREFARQARVDVVMDRQDVQGVQSNEVSGLLIPRIALERMLEGTPLVFKEDLETGAFAVTRSKESVADLTTINSEPQIPGSEYQPEEQTDMNVKKNNWLRALTAVLAVFVAEAPQISAQEDEENIVYDLSPFEVATTEDGDYHVSDTLAGNRLRTEMKDIGAALTHISKDFLDDLGVSDIMEMADLIPSVTAINTHEGGSTDINGSWRDQRFRIRGIFTEFASRNYHAQSTGTMLGSDGYNIDRITVSAGANSILFGAANPAGVINTSTLKAITGTRFSKLLYRTNNYGTQRIEAHHNTSILDDRVALRVAYLNEKGKRFPEPAFRNQDRIYLAGKWRITENTTLTGNFEYAEIERNAPIWGNYRNNSGAWEDSGSPLVEFTGSRDPDVPDNIWYTSGFPFQQLVFGEDGQGDTNTFTLAGRNWVNRPRGAPNEVTVNNFIREPVDPSITGGRNYSINQRINDQTGSIGDIAIEQKFSDKFYMQAAVFYSTRREDVWTAWNAQSLIRDAASTLLDGSPNPNAGGYYVDIGVPQLRDSQFDNFNFRWTATYELDLEEHSKWLGRHQFAAMFEDREGTRKTNRGQLFNTGSSRPNQNNYLSGQNKLRAIVFVDPTTTNNADPDLRDLAQMFNTFSAQGINAEWRNFREGTHEENFQKSYLLAAHSHFLDGRLVTTAGYRIDEQDFYTILANRWARDENRFFIGFKDHEVDPELVDEISGVSESTYSVGGVFHMIENKEKIDHLSLTYNKSNNFQPSQGFPTFDGSVRGGSEGETEDIGIKLGLFGGKLNAALNFFDSGQLRARGRNVAAMTLTWNGIWEDLEEETGDQSFLDNLLPGQSSNSDTHDLASEGIEFQLTYRPVPNWRISFLASKNETIRTNVLPDTQKFIAERWPALRAAHGDFIPSDGGNQTVNERLDNALADLQALFAEEGLQPLQQREYKFSLTTNYRFRDKLKGWSVGGFVQWQDEPAIGFNRDETGTPIPVERIFGDTLLNSGLNIGHSQMILNGKVEWVNQLNIRNLFDDTDVQPIRADETALLSKVPYVWNYQFREPRSFIFTSTFKF